MKIFISGGAKNGKSYYAQTRAKEIAESLGLPLYYVATMIPVDDEDKFRIHRHLNERAGWGFTTIEKPTHLSEIFDGELETETDGGDRITPRGVFLVDSVTAILSNAMFPIAAEEMTYGYNPDAPDEVAHDLESFSNRAENVVFVSDYIYGSYRPKNESDDYNDRADDDHTDDYVRGLAHVDRRLAEVCDQVIEISAGIATIHKSI